MGATTGCERRIAGGLANVLLPANRSTPAGVRRPRAGAVVGVLFALAVPAAAAGATDGASPATVPQRASARADPVAEYRIGPNDELAVGVRGHADLSRVVQVRPDGYVSLPLVEDLRAAERTPAELTAEIRRRLAAFVVEPEVAVEVLESVGSVGRQIRIVGEAVEPRAIPFRTGMTALDALTEVSGLTPFADGDAAVLVRGDPLAPRSIPLRLDDLLEQGDLAANLPLQPGDVIIVPKGVFAGDWQTRAAVSLSTTYTDNYSLDPDGQRDPALITALTPSVSISGQGARVSGALSAAVSGQYRALADPGPEVLFDVLGTSKAELARDSVFVDAAASILQQQLSTTSASSTTEANNTNLTLVQAYSVSPYWVTRVKDFADVEARYLFGATLTGDTGGERGRANSVDDSQNLSDSVTNGAVVTLRSPRDIAPRLQLQQATYGVRTTRFGASDVTAAGAAVTPSYAVAPGFALLATGGYDVLDAGQQDLSGPNVAGGFRYRPTPAFSVYASGGWRLENPQADVFLRYNVGPETAFGLGYNESVGVGQTNLLQNLGTLAYDPITGRFVDQQTNFAFSQALSGLDINNQLTRSQRGTATVLHRHGSNDYSLDLYAAQQKAIDNGRRSGNDGASVAADQTSWGAVAGWRRALGADTRLLTSLSFSYTDASDESQAGTNPSNDAATGTFRTVFAGVGVSHALTETLSGYVGYRFQQRFASDSDDAFTENAVLLAITQAF